MQNNRWEINIMTMVTQFDYIDLSWALNFFQFRPGYASKCVRQEAFAVLALYVYLDGV